MSAVTEVIERYSLKQRRNIREWVPGSDRSIADIRSGILFVLATWSGQSIGMLLRLMPLLGAGGTKLLVCDIDLLPLTERAVLGDLRGNGEAFWIVDGRVVASLLGPVSDDALSVEVARNNRVLGANRSH